MARSHSEEDVGWDRLLQPPLETIMCHILQNSRVEGEGTLQTHRRGRRSLITFTIYVPFFTQNCSHSALTLEGTAPPPLMWDFGAEAC